MLSTPGFLILLLFCICINSTDKHIKGDLIVLNAFTFIFHLFCVTPITEMIGSLGSSVCFLKLAGKKTNLEY